MKYQALIIVAGGIVLTVLFMIRPMSALIGFFRQSMRMKKLLQSGVNAQATVIEAVDTGIRINDNPQIDLKLRVQPTGGAPFEATVRQTISILQMGLLQPGETVEVRYDPKNPHLLLVTGFSSGAQAFNPADALQKLIKINELNKHLLKTGVVAKATVLECQPMGIEANGPNPVVALTLRVEPEGKPPFQAKAHGPIIQSSLSKFQPGNPVTVRYNPDDLTQVTIEHSG